MPPISISAANTLDEVIAGLDQVISYARLHNSRLGFFPCLYKKVTIAVKEGIAEGTFSDGARMERLDVVFANRYLIAIDAWLQGRPCSHAWEVAFRAADQAPLIALQHLLLGMNAHINLDLSVAAAEVAPGAAVHHLKSDFYRINLVLMALVDQVQDELGQVSPLIRVLDRLAGRADELMASQGIRLMRNLAWRNAINLARLKPEKLPAKIMSLDNTVTRLGQKIVRPPLPLRAGIAMTRLGEQMTPADMIYRLDTLPLHRATLSLPHDWEADMEG
ncbi:MAG: DUF5995 family protein [Bacteroidia bacterium]|nr:DUF5995 family protein [Bacteroidia bacterium]